MKWAIGFLLVVAATLLGPSYLTAAAASPNPNSSSAKDPRKATKIQAGSELFKDTVYSKSVVAANEPFSHAIIEGGRNRIKLQTDPLLEAKFLDRGYHFGPPEMIQLEQNTEKKWELVHYRYPWGPRNDLLPANGLVRDVIMNISDGLTSPVGVHAVTNSATNQFWTSPSGASSMNAMGYALFVQQMEGEPSFFIFGNGQAQVDHSTGFAKGEYPVEWQIVPAAMGNIDLSNLLGPIQSVDKYSSPAWHTNAKTGKAAIYEPWKGTEHILIYYESALVVVTHHTLNASYRCNKPAASFQIFPYPEKDAKLVHLDWSPLGYIGTDCANTLGLSNIVFVSSGYNPQADTATYTTYTMEFLPGILPHWFVDQFPKFDLYGSRLISKSIKWVANTHTFSMDIPSDLFCASSPNKKYKMDFSQLKAPHSIFTVVDQNNGIHSMKLASLDDNIIILRLFQDAPSSSFALAGAFPLKLPDTLNGRGKIISFEGGTSKFGGMRFSVLDANGNYFQMRQRGFKPNKEDVYHQPIYGLFNKTGYPLTDPGTTPITPPPPCSQSNVGEMRAWFSKTNTVAVSTVSEDLLTSLAYAFGTTELNMAQGLYLGNNFTAAYSPSRFAHDSSHVLVKETKTSHGEAFYTSYTEFKCPLTKAWKKQPMVSQILPSQNSEQLHAEFYHATLKLVNDDGLQVPYSKNCTNAGFSIEVRSDTPVTIQDTTNHLHHDVDRYTSFLAAPDQHTGELSLTVKAENFAQVLYVRMVDTRSVQVSPDSSTATLSKTFPWQSVNIAAQAQTRMKNDGTAKLATATPSTMMTPDTTVYVSENSLMKGDQDQPWDFKANFRPTNETFSTVAKFATSSAQTMVAFHNSSNSGYSAVQALNPLTDLTYFKNKSPNFFSSTASTTTFDYKNGKLGSGVAAISGGLGEVVLGDIFDDIAHIVHDVAHFLENTVAFDALEDAVVEIQHVVDEFCQVAISPSLMFIVSGVFNECKRLMRTAQEFGSFVVWMVRSVVAVGELLWNFIVALVSLFFHLGDILALSKSMEEVFNGVLSKNANENSAQQPSFESLGMKFLGKGSQANSALRSVPSEDVATEIVGEIGHEIFKIVNFIMNNPVTKKIINKISSVLSDVSAPPPFTINLADPSAFSGGGTEIADLGVSLLSQLGIDVVEGMDLIENMAEDIFSPKSAFEKMQSDLGNFLEGIVDDAVDPILKFMDKTASAQNDPQAIYGNDNFITVTNTVFADLLKLIGVGKSEGSNVLLSGGEAIFFPMALVTWVTHYTISGSSINSFQGLVSVSAGHNNGTSASLTGNNVAASFSRDWNLRLISIVNDLVFSTSESAFLWSLEAIADDPFDGPAVGATTAYAFFGLIRWAGSAFFSFYEGGFEVPCSIGVWSSIRSIYRLAMTSFFIYMASNPSDDAIRNEATLTMYLTMNALEAALDVIVRAFSIPNSDSKEKIAVIMEMIAESRDIGFMIYSWGKPGTDAWVDFVGGYGVMASLLKSGNFAMLGRPHCNRPSPAPPLPAPTLHPSQSPTSSPTKQPTKNPTTLKPTSSPTFKPTPSPHDNIFKPTSSPTTSPTPSPSAITCGCPDSCTAKVLARPIVVNGNHFTCASYIHYLRKVYNVTETNSCKAAAYQDTACCPCTHDNAPCNPTAPYQCPSYP